MKFVVIDSMKKIVQNDIIYLQYIHYDDYGYCTSYRLYVKEDEKIKDFGEVKIGCVGLNYKARQGESQNGFASYSVNDVLPHEFDCLDKDFFSLGQDLQYYKDINSFWGEGNEKFYKSLNDIAFDFQRFEYLYETGEASLINSLMREIHYPNVEQFHRVSQGDAELTRYRFKFKYEDQSIEFTVKPNELPPSNIHVLIGRNGVGKTWLLYNMVSRILESMDLTIDEDASQKYKLNNGFTLAGNKTRFAGVVGMSFSVFDDALFSINVKKPLDLEGNSLSYFNDDFAKKYKYIGLLKKIPNEKENDILEEINSTYRIKSVGDLAQEFVECINKISEDRYKKQLCIEMCKNLDTDTMFKENKFVASLEQFFDEKERMKNKITKLFKKLSSGHMIIVLSLISLCDSISEKTIVFIDEPETHLHPPLLSTYIRTLSFLLRKRNAVGIIATHSPIVLQEVPSNCVTKVERTNKDMFFYRPQIETFASGTDQLTREIFGYEIMKTGFYKLIKENLQDTFEETECEFENKIGFLGQIMIQGLINKREGEDNEQDSDT